MMLPTSDSLRNCNGVLVIYVNKNWITEKMKFSNIKKKESTNDKMKKKHRFQLFANICDCFKTVGIHLQCNNSNEIQSMAFICFKNYCYLDKGT